MRPATLEDATLAADLMTAAYPALPEDPILTRYRWEHPRKAWSVGRYIAGIGGRPIAFVEWKRGPRDQDPDRHCELGVWLDRADLDVELLTFLWQCSISMRMASAC